MPGVQQADIFMVQGDLGPVLKVVLHDVKGNPLDLSAATHVWFQAKHQEKNAGFKGAATVVIPTIDPGTHLPTGRVDYTWQAGDTDQSGWYNVDFRVEGPDGKPRTIPNYTTRQMYIRPRLR